MIFPVWLVGYYLHQIYFHILNFAPLSLKEKKCVPAYIYIYADIQTLIQSVFQEFAVKAIKH